ncbi:hypothetical protein HDU87_003779, partial [Geranomyces variabilis]
MPMPRRTLSSSLSAKRDKTLASIKSKAAGVAKDVKKGMASVTHHKSLDPLLPKSSTEEPEKQTVEQLIQKCIVDYNALIDGDHPDMVQAPPAFNPVGWQSDHASIFQRYKELALMIRTITEDYPQHADRLSFFMYEWLVVVDVIFIIEVVRLDRILKCQIRAGQYSKLLKILTEVDVPVGKISMWIYEMDQILDNIYTGLKSDSE